MNTKNMFVILRNKSINVKQGIRYEDKEVCVIANQEVYDLNQDKMSFEKVIELYKNKVELSNVISNAFTIIIIDKIQNKLMCIQDLNGDTVPIYYYKNNEEIIITNKIINIIHYCYKPFYMNERAISFF